MTRTPSRLFAAAAAIALTLLTFQQTTAIPADHTLIAGGLILA